MGRTSTFSDEKVFTAVAAQVAQGDGFRIQDLAKDTGISVGSLYHRYGSREGIMAAAWLEALQSFQQVFLTALQSDRKDAGEHAALVTPQFSRTHRAKAVILCVGRHEAFLNDKAPQDVKQAVDMINDEIQTALAAFSERESLDLQACMHAIIAFPLASVRLYLPHKEVPTSVDQYVRAAYQSAIGLGGGSTPAKQQKT